MQRRKFLHTTGKSALGLSLLGLAAACANEPGTGDSATEVASTEDMLSGEVAKWFDISLAQWSLHKMLRGGEMDNLDFAGMARNTFGVGGIEYVNQFFKDKATDSDYLKEMQKRAMDADVKSLLIMIDREGDLGDTDKKARMQAVENHYKWIDAAKYLGCHSIRVNAAGEGSREEVAKAATEGLATLSEYGKERDINVIVENHGGYSSDGQWLAGVIKGTGMDNCGTLPDFGNFCVERNNPEKWEDGCKTEYDRYRGVEELMPFAKAVSAKAYDFDAAGLVTETNYAKMMKIVQDAGYKGWIGIEYEGNGLTEKEGIKKTIEVLQQFGGRLG
ncbi:sugar phosphate isomerase/epimerase [Lewinella sp. 4G2]|uniref:sugar phosphate isomerase/epimerase family protein n=1 Tax=Lewinella sp. 4G2 TaxID=1803372 RepID=UPI0007B49EDA|nr:TIM barrel protein [Lewinella sp. 4G2]OAV43094.1 xylose isomerase [Lewinella sp. 4G2]